MHDNVTDTDFISALIDTDDRRPALLDTGTTMQFTIRRFILQILLEKAATVVPWQASAMAVLKNFRFELSPDRLRITATDTELSMIATTEMVTVEQAGIAVFPARKLAEIVREAEDADVHITVANLAASIRIGRTSWRLKLAVGDDYPALPKINDVVFTAVDRTAFASALHTVRYATPTASRASLAMIDVRDGRMIACDGARYQQVRFETLPFPFRIPIGAVDDLTRLLKITDLDTIHIGESDNHLIVRFAADVFVINKLVAQFPDLDAMFLRPALENRHQLTVDKAHLLVAVKRIRINADQETSAIALTLTEDIEGGKLTVTARDKYGNTASEEVEAGWAGAGRTIVVNHQFLADLLNAYRNTVCVFWLGDDTKTRRSPLMLRDDEHGTVGVVQQMQADWVGQ